MPHHITRPSHSAEGTGLHLSADRL
jgi:hypothetical protein